MDSNPRIDYLYKEYTRLNEKSEEYLKSSYEDFKFLGAIGAIIVFWKSIADIIVLSNAKVNYSSILFLGFLSLLFTVAVIGFMNLVKQSYIFFFIDNLQGYEKDIRKELAIVEDSRAFSLNTEKVKRGIKTYYLTFGAFIIITSSTITLIPFIVLLNSSVTNAVIYLLIAIMILVFYLKVLKRTVNQYFK